MSSYEYRVVPAPRTAAKEKGLKGTDQRFAHTLAQLMNELGAQGWEYVRAETLPCEERRGLTGRAETTQHVLVFKRDRGTRRMPSLSGFTGTGEGTGQTGTSKLILEGGKKP